MDFDFQCDCGHKISEFTRGNTLDVNLQVVCEECGAVYALTITQLQTVE